MYAPRSDHLSGRQGRQMLDPRLSRRALIIASATAAGAHALHLPAIAPARKTDDLAWWQKGTIYEINARSFQDTDGDGSGDLPGIIRHLDYLTWLGVDSIWITPTYPSPWVDFGYDISDYTDIDPLFGTLADMDALITAAHTRGIRVVLDFVASITSDQHPWFIESRSSRDNPKHDWYIWHDPAAGSEPTNWRSFYGDVTAWTWDETRRQYYYHAFLPEEPSLNWRNPDVVAAMHDTLRFWLDRGVDGFRMDPVSILLVDDQFRDNPENVWLADSTRTNDLPGVIDIVRGFRAVLDEYEDRMMVAELFLPIDRLMAYYGTSTEPAFHLVFNFELITETAPWRARSIGAYVADYDSAIPENGWPTWVLGTHDQPRVASRVGVAMAPIAALLLLALRGTPTLYYGDEIGMVDVDIPPNRLLDPVGIAYPGNGRDPERTPMQWDATGNAGFTTGEPWLPLGDTTSGVTIADQRDEPHSILTLYRRLLALRRERPALHAGAYREVLGTSKVLVWERALGNDRLIVVLHIDLGETTIAIPEIEGGRIVLATNRSREGETTSADLTLAGYEGVIIDLSGPPSATPAG